ncbi:MAG TPA: hypothetical protein VMN57_10180 [Anaerolineales bacterium]|nr:hypothetical protein [Anaerolineales bacterium]
MSTSPQSPPVIKFVPAAIVLGGLGWTAVVWLFLNAVPYAAGVRWLFFLSFFLAVSGSALPGIAFLNRRFPGRIPATQAVVLRQSAWVGLYAAALAWLQIGRLVTFATAALIGVGLLILETVFRLREIGGWRP